MPVENSTCCILSLDCSSTVLITSGTRIVFVLYSRRSEIAIVVSHRLVVKIRSTGLVEMRTGAEMLDRNVLVMVTTCCESLSIRAPSSGLELVLVAAQDTSVCNLRRMCFLAEE